MLQQRARVIQISETDAHFLLLEIALAAAPFE
jgi:hypothetical protein